MVVYLWKYLWKKTQSSLRYVKIALCAIVVYLLILSVFARVFQTNKVNLYPKKTTAVKTDEIRAFITDKKINSTRSGKLIISLYKGTVCSLIGEACYDDLDKKNPSNASTFIASILAYPLLNPPASGVGVTVQTLAQAGFIPKSYAAEGVGFASISPLMGVWKALRDVAYLVLVLVIVTIGFMIMLRTKINPQTVVNVENALPKIVMALIYITFSFAIAGFLIDLMYIVIVLVIAILAPQYTAVTPTCSFCAPGPRTSQELIKTFIQSGPWNILTLLFNFSFFSIFWTLPTALLGILGSGISAILRIIISGASIFFLQPFIDRALHFMGMPDVSVGAAAIGTINLSNLISSLLTWAKSSLGWIIAVTVGFFLVPIILGIVIFFTVLMLFFRIFFLLFSNYIKLLLLIVVSPLFLIMEAIPGQSAFGSWIKNILEILVAFPVIIAIFLIGSIIMGTSTTTANGALFTPPFLVGLNPQYLSAIIGMWILFMIPDFVGIAQKAINSKPLPLDAGIGTFFGGAKTGVSTGLSEISKYAYVAQYVPPIKKVFDMLGMKTGGQHDPNH